MPKAGDWPPYTIEWYREGDYAPVYRWLTEELSEEACELIGAAMLEILQADGPDVCETRFGRQLGKGLFEFRLDGNPQAWIDEGRKRRGKQPKKRVPPEDEVQYRIFCHAHGGRIILLLGAYDKGRDVSKKRQSQEIAAARKRLREWQRKQKLQAKAQSRSPRKKQKG